MHRVQVKKIRAHQAGSMKMTISVIFWIITSLSLPTWGATLQPNTYVTTANNVELDPFRPFGSNRPCSELLNETMEQHEASVIIERILSTADTMASSFSSQDPFSPRENQKLETWAHQACGKMQNAVGFLNMACQYNAPSSFDIIAQKKVRALMTSLNYLCSNGALNLKEMAINSGAQCIRRTLMPDFGCIDQLGSSSPISPTRGTTPRYSTSIILAVPNYSNESCRFVSEKTSCILDKYVRSADFCNPRLTQHMSRIVALMMKAVQCDNIGSSSFDSTTLSNFNVQTPLPPFFGLNVPNFNNPGYSQPQPSGVLNNQGLYQGNANSQYPIGNPQNTQFITNSPVQNGFMNNFQNGYPDNNGNNNLYYNNNGNFLADRFTVSPQRRWTTIPPWTGDRKRNGAISLKITPFLLFMSIGAAFFFTA